MSASALGAAWRARAAAWLRRAVELDLRSLASLRIALGLSVLATLASYAGVVRDFVPTHSVVSVGAMRELTPVGARVLLIPFELAPRAAALLLLSTLGAASLALAVGYWSRASCFACWLLLAALHARAPVLLNFGDEILLRILFWSCALPIGARFSLDARRAAACPARSAASWGSAALLLQLCAIYAVAGAVKTGVEWGSEASAVHFVLGHKSMATPLADWLRSQREITAWISRSVPLLELCMPLFLLTPVFQTQARLLAVAGIWGFHASLSLFLHLGVFPFACMGLATALLPSAFWDRIARLRGRALREQTQPAPLGSGRIAALGIAALLLLSAGFAIETLTLRSDLVPGPLRRAGEALALTQPWTMYAPGVDRWDAWTNARARVTGAGEIDLLRGGAPFSLDPPAELPWSGQDFRGTLLLHAVAQHPRLLARPYLRRLCRHWNRAHPEARVESVDLQRAYVDLEREGSPVRERRRVAKLQCPSPRRASFATIPEFG